MSADVLREAVALMRERAEAAEHIRPTPWVLAPDGESLAVWSGPKARLAAFGEFDSITEHIASWHPAVALAVADWLEESADHIEAGEENDDLLPHVCPTALEGLECSVLLLSLAVARAYLGSAS